MDLRQLTRRYPHAGRVEAIFLRAARDVPASSVTSAVALAGRGLEGDRSAGTARSGVAGRRQVTLLQAEHVPLVAAWIGRPVDPAALRRNLLVSGVNLLAARTLFADQPVRIAIGTDVVLAVTGPCEPCSKMENALGPGAYQALRGHGGVTATVEVGGRFTVGDAVRLYIGPVAGAR